MMLFAERALVVVVFHLDPPVPLTRERAPAAPWGRPPIRTQAFPPPRERPTSLTGPSTTQSSSGSGTLLRRSAADGAGARATSRSHCVLDVRCTLSTRSMLLCCALR